MPAAARPSAPCAPSRRSPAHGVMSAAVCCRCRLWEFPVDWQRVSRPDFIRPGTRVVNNLQLGQALTGEMKLDPPIMGLYVYNTNPVSQAPQTNKIVKGLSREDLFFVTAEHFVTDTAAYADIVLPATMAGEHDDMMFSWGHFYLTINEKAIRAARRGQVQCRDLPPARRRHGLRRSPVQDGRHGARRALREMGRAADGRHRHGIFPQARLFPSRRRHAGRPPAARQRQFPDAVRQGRVPGQGRQELRGAAVPHDVRGDAVGRGRRSASRLSAAARESRRAMPRAPRTIRSTSSRRRATASSIPATPTSRTRSKARASSS